MYSTIPNQRIPFSKKTKEWQKETVDAYLNLTDDGRMGRKEELRILYDYYNGVIRDSDYSYVVKPYGKARTNFPSKMRNYPLIKPTIDLLLGEKAKRPFNYSVTVVNSDSVDRREEQKQEAVLSNMKQRFVNDLNKMGFDTGVDTEEVPLPKNLAEMFDRTYIDNRALLGQKAMNYIVQQEEVHEKLQKAWFHFLVSGECYTHRGVRNNEVFFDILNPLDIDYDLDPDLDYVEDADWVVVTKYMNPSTIVEQYGEHLTPDQISEVMVMAGQGGDYFSNYSTTSAGKSRFNNRLIRVRILYWQSLQEVGFLTYPDPTTGSMETMQVESGHRISHEEKALGYKLEWKWHNRPWQAVVIGNDMHIDVRPVKDERVSIENPSKNKLPINGRRYSDINSANISLVMLGIPYQLNYNVFKYRMELSIARSKDVIAQLDINLIPKKWDMDKFMYYVEGTGIAWVDYNKEGVKLNPGHQSILDMSMKTIDMYVSLLQHIDQEWEKVSGVNRQRRGEVSEYQGKAMGQQAIIQSAHTTEDLYRKFAGMERRDLQALLDYSKHAWVNGKKTMFVMPDGTKEFLEIDPISWMESDLGIFISDATKEQEKFQQARELGQAMLQNEARPSMVLDMIDSESFLELKDRIKKAEKELEASRQAVAQEERRLEEARLQQEAKIHNENIAELEKDRQHEATQKELDRQNKIDVANISQYPKLELEQQEIPEPKEDKGPELALKSKEVKVKQDAQKETERHNKATEGIARSKPKTPGK